MCARTAVISALECGTALALAAQAGGPSVPLNAFQADLPKFEVASIKPGGPAGRVGIFTPPGGRLEATNVPLRMLITFAYGIQDFQLVSAPRWIDTERFDVRASGEADGSGVMPGEVGRTHLMLQELLVSRFKLATHREQRQMPIYALIVARRDGRLGARLRQSTGDCQTASCGFRIGPAPGQMTASGFPLSSLASTLAPFVSRAVVDQTGLTGHFDFDLTWTPDQPPSQAPKDGATGAPPDPNSPSLFTALQEQLGLKLQGARGPVSVIVVDRVERPTPD
jgi:uncharacterized protein (TIGR03435 family)